MTGIIDIHCHILPGVDDGAPDFDTAIAMLQKQYNDGIRTIIATPHYRKNLFEPSMESVIASWRALQAHASEIGIHLLLGCEYHVNMNIVEDIFGSKRPSLAYTKYVLSEFSGASTAEFIRERCHTMRSRSLVPVIAHVERYPSLTKDISIIEELSEMGCMIQLNAGSFLGVEGRTAKNFCKKMLEYNLVDLIASDSHDMKKRPPRLGDCAKWLEKEISAEYAEQILCKNPLRIINNQ